MFPARSIILFTTLTGMGYGMMMWLGIARFNLAGAAGLTSLIISGAFISVGLLFSFGHLGNPQRFWRAFTQWRSSWLSREGVLAIIAYVPIGLLGIGALFLGETWRAAGLAAAVMSLIVVYCTSMIYASLKTIHTWHTWLTSLTYVLFALATGAVAINGVFAAMGQNSAHGAWIAIAALIVAWAAKFAWWQRADTTASISTPESATGLGGDTGLVSLLERPHTGENYLTHEMGYQIARKHSAKLRRIAVLSGLIISGLLLLAGQYLGLFAVLAVFTAFGGVFLERWLFFAEAKHTVMLYYGAPDA